MAVNFISALVFVLLLIVGGVVTGIPRWCIRRRP